MSSRDNCASAREATSRSRRLSWAPSSVLLNNLVFVSGTKSLSAIIKLFMKDFQVQLMTKAGFSKILKNPNIKIAPRRLKIMMRT